MASVKGLDRVEGDAEMVVCTWEPAADVCAFVISDIGIVVTVLPPLPILGACARLRLMVAGLVPPSPDLVFPCKVLVVAVITHVF